MALKFFFFVFLFVKYIIGTCGLLIYQKGLWFLMILALYKFIDFIFSSFYCLKTWRKFCHEYKKLCKINKMLSCIKYHLNLTPFRSWVFPTKRRFLCGGLATMHCQPKQIFLNKSLLTTLFVPYVKWNQKLRLIYCEDAQLPNLSGACVVEGFKNGVLNMKTLCLLLLIYIAFWIWLRWHY